MRPVAEASGAIWLSPFRVLLADPMTAEQFRRRLRHRPATVERPPTAARPAAIQRRIARVHRQFAGSDRADSRRHVHNIPEWLQTTRSLEMEMIPVDASGSHRFTGSSEERRSPAQASRPSGQRADSHRFRYRLGDNSSDYCPAAHKRGSE